MAKFVVLYKGGAMAETPEAQEAAMNRWMAWFGGLGAATTDVGNPFGSSTGVSKTGALAAATTGVTGYTILEAPTLEQASKLVAGCPIYDGGGSVEIYEAMPM
jgi:hypothetical protein